MSHYKGFAMPRDIPLFFAVFFCLAYYSVLLKIMPLQRIILLENHHAHAGGNDNITPADRILLDKTYRAAGFLLRRLWRSKRPCLRRSLVVSRLCRGRKLKSRIIIGVKKSEAGLESHAWLEIGSFPFRENPGSLAGFTPIVGEKN